MPPAPPFPVIPIRVDRIRLAEPRRIGAGGDDVGAECASLHALPLNSPLETAETPEGVGEDQVPRCTRLPQPSVRPQNRWLSYHRRGTQAAPPQARLGLPSGGWKQAAGRDDRLPPVAGLIAVRVRVLSHCYGPPPWKRRREPPRANVENSRDGPRRRLDSLSGWSQRVQQPAT